MSATPKPEVCWGCLSIAILNADNMCPDCVPETKQFADPDLTPEEQAECKKCKVCGLWDFVECEAFQTCLTCTEEHLGKCRTCGYQAEELFELEEECPNCRYHAENDDYDRAHPSSPPEGIHNWNPGAF